MLKKHVDLPYAVSTTLAERQLGECRFGHALSGEGLIVRKRYTKDGALQYKCRECYNIYQRAVHEKFPKRYALSSEEESHRHRKVKYKISPADYAEMIARQRGCCAICLRERKLVVDHNHKTGQVRGLLCLNCNTALGQVRESEEVLTNMLSYLLLGDS